MLMKIETFYKKCHAALFAITLLTTSQVYAEMNIFASSEDIVPKDKSSVMIEYLQSDDSGTTSLRFETDREISDNKFTSLPGAPNNNRIAPPSQPKVQQRDRDLGQTFLTGDKAFKLDAVYLRVGFSDKAVLEGARNAPVVLQFFEVSGKPRLNDSGTPGFKGFFDRAQSPELDDYIEGETFRPIAYALGKLPDKLGKGYYLKFDLQGQDEIELKPNTHYGFVLGFTQRAPKRALALANSYYGQYQPDPKNKLIGHGIRREGGIGKIEAPYFKPDLPDSLEEHLALAPDTLGFPDVCTYRDLFFALTAVPGTVK